jgi:transposase-like protein
MNAETKLPTTLQEAIVYFSDPDRSHALAVAFRWPDGRVTCPTCGREDVRFLASRRVWECKSKHGKRQFSAKVGTIFEDSPISFDKWFVAIWMLANCKNGVSSYEIHRAIHVTQKTGWFMLQRIRLAMQSKSFAKMSGEVEADETFIGGLARNMHKGKRAEKITGTGGSGKAMVLGMLERTGRKPSQVRATVVENRRKGTLQQEVRSNVAAGSALYTDALPSYNGLGNDYAHQVIDHATEYVRGNVHTNGIENFWSLLKRGIKGTYVSVEPFHLFRYIDEQAFRFNNRKDNDGDRFNSVAGSVVGKRLTYSRLIGKEVEPSVN